MKNMTRTTRVNKQGVTVQVLFRGFSSAIVQWRWLVLILCALFTGFMLVCLQRLVVDNNPDVWSPSRDPFVKATKEIESSFGGRHFTIIGVRSRHGTSLDERILAKVARIEAGIEALPEAVKSNVLTLTSEKVKDVYGSDETLQTRQLLSEWQRTKDLSKAEQALSRNSVYKGALISDDATTVAVVADFRIEGEYSPLLSRIQAVVDRERDDTVEIFMAGEPVLSARTESAMENLPKFFGMAFLIIAAIQLYGFRSLQGMLLPLLTAIFAVIWTMGTLALTGVHVDPLSSTTPILIMAMATGHSIQILKRYYEEYQNAVQNNLVGAPAKSLSRSAVVTSLIRVGPVTLTAGLIAAISFFSLAISDTAVIRQFGIFAGTGALMIVALEFTFIPALRSVLPAPRIKPRRPDLLDQGLTRLSAVLLSPKQSLRLAIVSTAILLAIIAGSLHLRVYNSFLEYYPVDSEVHRAVDTLNHRFGGADSITFLIDTGKPDGVKQAQVLKVMDELQVFLSRQPNVGKTLSMADVIKRMHQAMNSERADMSLVPDSTPLISQYLLLYSMSGSMSDFGYLVDSGFRKTVVRAFLRSDDTLMARRICEEGLAFLQERLPPGVVASVGGGLAESVAINDSVVKAKQFNILQMVVVVFVLSSLVFRSLVAGLLVALPLLAILAANLGFMGWAGISLDMGSATVIAMVIGIGADYEIYMLSRLREEHARTGDLPLALAHSLVSSGKAVLLVALSIAGGYAALLTSDFGFYPRLGTTMIATMLTSAMLSLVLLRVVISLIRPRFIVQAATSEAEPCGVQS